MLTSLPWSESNDYYIQASSDGQNNTKMVLPAIHINIVNMKLVSVYFSAIKVYLHPVKYLFNLNQSLQ